MSEPTPPPPQGKPNPLASLAHLRGLGEPFLFAMDGVTLEKENIVVGHFVRCETITFDRGPEFDKLQFKTAVPGSDARLDALIANSTKGMRRQLEQNDSTVATLTAALRSLLDNPVRTRAMNESYEKAVQLGKAMLATNRGQPMQAQQAIRVAGKLCNQDLRREGKAMPRTCAVCGLGPCLRYK